MDTFTTLWNRLLLRAPLDPLLAQEMVRDSFQQFAERREWSWLQRSSAFFPPSITVTGSVAVTSGLVTVIGTGTNFDASMVGKQFRLGASPSSYPTYTITQVPSATSLLLDAPWTGSTLTGQAFQIFQCYFPVPADFQYFYSIVNVTSNYRLYHNLTQAEIDLADPQRVQIGIAYAASFHSYTTNFNGTVGAALQVRGSGPVPVSTTSYGFQFPADSVYTIEITTGGASGAAIFEWKQDSGSYTTGVATDTNPIDLSNGVQVYFPAGTYVQGDVFVIQCKAGTTTGVPRYELWPRPINTPYVYPFLYIAKLPALSDAAPQLPPFVSQRGDVILEMALEKAAMWPGTAEVKNPYYDLNLARQHQIKSEKMIFELEKKDDDTAIKDLMYTNLPYYPMPWLDGSFLQSHAIYPTP